MQSDIFKRKVDPNMTVSEGITPEPVPSHQHKHYWTENKGTYEPVYVEGELYYQFVMYSYSACNCGQSAKRTKIV